MDNSKNRLFYTVFMFALFFIILGFIPFFKIDNVNISSTALSTLFFVWFLNMFLLFLISYYAILYNTNCRWFIFLLYILALLFASLFAINFMTNLALSNLFIVLTLIFSLAILYYSHLPMLILGILYLLSWLGLFAFLNNDV